MANDIPDELMRLSFTPINILKKLGKTTSCLHYIVGRQLSADLAKSLVRSFVVCGAPPKHLVYAQNAQKMEVDIMKVNELVIDVAKTLGVKLIVTAVRPRYLYRDGVRTNELRGYAYDCVCPQRNYAQVTVAVDGPKTLGDDAVARNAVVQLSNPDVKVYWASGEYRVSITAEGIHTVKADG